MSNILAERLGDEMSETAERTCDDGTLRITIEVQRQQRGNMGYFVPIRDELSPRFLALLPLMNTTRKLRLVIWPGFDWWNGSIAQKTRRTDNPKIHTSLPPSPPVIDAASFAIERILEYLPAVEELTLDVLIHVSDAGRWDLPDNKWEQVQPWLDGSISTKGGKALKKVVRKLSWVWNSAKPEAFYTQVETRQDSGMSWKVERWGDMRTHTLRSIHSREELEPFAKGTVNDSFERTY